MSKAIFETIQSLSTGKQIPVDELFDKDSLSTAQVATATGTQALADALDSRVIRVDSIAALITLDTFNLSSGQQFNVLSYYAPVYPSARLHGGGIFYWDAVSTEAENGFTIFGSAAQGRFKRAENDRLDAAMAGLIDSDTEDQTTKYNTLMNDAPPGSVIDMLGYTVYLTAPVTVSNSLEIKNGGTVLTDFSLTFTGSYSLEGNLTSAASQGDLSLTYSGPAVEEGSVLVVHNDVDYSLNVFRPVYHDGEFIVAGESAAGSITAVTPLKSSYPSSANSKIFKINLLSIDIEGLVVRNKGDAAPADSLLDFIHCTGTLRGVKAYGGYGRSFGVVESFNLTLHDCLGYNTTAADGTQYGIAVVSSQNIKTNGGAFWAVRHGATTGARGGDLTIPCRNVVFEGSAIGSTALYSADFHGNSIDCYYKDCHITNGAGLGGCNVGVIGGTVVAGAPNASAIGWHELYDGSFTVDGAVIDMDGQDQPLSKASSSSLSLQVANSLTVSIRNIQVINDQNMQAPPFIATNRGATTGLRHVYSYHNITFENPLTVTADRVVSLEGGASFSPLSRISLTSINPEGNTYWYAGSAEVVTSLDTFIEVPVRAADGTV